jgi:hypothetical protein
MTTNTMPKRHRARWNASELNRLHNEYEMKELTVQEIADLHGRTVYGVMSKLQAEGLIDSSWNNARGWVFQSDSPSQSSPKQSLSLQPALQFDQDDDTESIEHDDSEDEDYVPQEEEDEEEDEEEEEDEDEDEFDPYSMKQKVTFLEQQVTNIFSFLQRQFPKQKVITASM